MVPLAPKLSCRFSEDRLQRMVQLLHNFITLRIVHSFIELGNRKHVSIENYEFPYTDI